jgi:tetratricopeptide (TPR) repeat protein
MARGAREIWNRFYRGDTSALLAETVDGKRGACPPGAIGAVIGALVFAGRIDEAEHLYGLERSKLGPAERVEALFLLASGFTRHSDDARSRKYLVEGMRERRHARDAKSRFYLYQGLGFRGFFTADYRKGLTWARLAARAAIRARFPFGKAFALELLGHCQAQVGEISEGLRNIELAIAQAKLLGDGGLARSFRIAHVLYQAQFGRDSERTLASLLELAEGALEAFPYSRANVLLELGRQLRLRGDLEGAKRYLDRAAPLIYQLGHRRCAITLKLRYAALLEARGEEGQALQLTRGALAEIHSRFDRGLEIEVRGMEARLLQALGMRSEGEATEALVERLASRTGKFTQLRMQARSGRGGPGQAELRLAEDPLGDLIDRVARAREASLSAVVSSGYLGLCRDVLGVEKGSRLLVLRAADEHPLLFDQGSVSLVAENCTPLMWKFLGLLSRGSLSKEKAIREIWGYSYSPLRHDSLIYRLAARTRAALGSHGHWLEMTEKGYRLAAGVRVIRIGHDGRPGELSYPSGEKLERLERLNHRQLEILRELGSDSYIDVKICKKKFEVSEITARRDLGGLLKLGELVRLGKGRAVKYKMIGRRTS